MEGERERQKKRAGEEVIWGTGQRETPLEATRVRCSKYCTCANRRGHRPHICGDVVPPPAAHSPPPAICRSTVADIPHPGIETRQAHLQWDNQEHHQHGYETGGPHVGVEKVHEHSEHQGADPQLMDKHKGLTNG